MGTKTCTFCGETKPLDEFKKDKRRRDGREGRCKKCFSQRYPTDPERAAQYRDRYKGRYDWSKYSQTARSWHERNPLAQKAYRLVSKSVARGEMPKASECLCAHCGGSAAEYHHHRGYGAGYELDVIPLCHRCHRLAHSELV